MLAVASDSGEIVLLSTSEGVQLSLLPVSESALTCVAYSHSGDVLAAGSLNGSLNFMQVADEGLSYQSLSILKVKPFSFPGQIDPHTLSPPAQERESNNISAMVN